MKNGAAVFAGGSVRLRFAREAAERNPDYK